MLVLSPRSVRFGGKTWENVALVAVDRVATRQSVEWGDRGPHVVFADVAAQRVNVRVVLDMSGDDVGAPLPGETGLLTFYTARSASESGRVRVSLQAVVTGVSHEISLKRGVARTLDFVGVSSDGAADPVSVVAVGAES
ncbi:MAG: hypothetical protein HUU18_12985 [Phycisphaerales bacterium]|nr:hypothetical protein [Phycisphaerales bacterium]